MQRKILTLVLILLAAGSASYAQYFKYGVKAGADIHKISGKTFSDQFSYGYHVGAFADIGITSRFGVQPEILLSQVNVDTSSDYNTVYKFNNMGKAKLQYLKIPLLFNYMPNKIVSFQVGPQYGILLDKNANLVENGKNAFKQGDFSLLGGLQLNIDKIKLYGRYAVGLNNINDLDNREKWKNQNIQVGVGYTF